MTKLAAKLPDDNGLYSINRALIETPDTRHIVVMVVDCKSTTTDHEKGDWTEATARIRTIEPITDPRAVEIVEQALRFAADRRNGRVPLPIVDPKTGVIMVDSEAG